MMFERSTIDSEFGECDLRRSERTTLSISVMPDGSIQILAPVSASEEKIRERITKRSRWITRQQKMFAQMNAERVPLRYENGATHRYLGKQYRIKIIENESKSVRLIGRHFIIQAPNKTSYVVQSLMDDWYRKKAKQQFLSRLKPWESFCQKHNMPVPHLKIRRMPNRWGSADNKSGHILLNPELVKAPSRCIDYVITHEICHLRYPNHCKQFYSMLGHLCPQWKQLKERLEQM